MFSISFRPSSRECCHASKQMKMLQKQVSQLKLLLETRKLKWRREKAVLLAKIRNLDKSATAVTKLRERGTLSSQQVRRLATGKRLRWTAEEIGVAVGLRCLSRKAYGYVQHVMCFPMPSASTLSLRTRGFRLTEGIIEGAKQILSAAAQGMSDIDRLCVVSFDEMSLNGRWCFDNTTDQATCATKLQLLMVRGLCSSWKQPYYYAMDTAMTVDVLNQVVVELETDGLMVVAAVTDLGPTNVKMWGEAGICNQKTYIENPADPERYSNIAIIVGTSLHVRMLRHQHFDSC